jgi:hypothetical protein
MRTHYYYDKKVQMKVIAIKLSENSIYDLQKIKYQQKYNPTSRDDFGTGELMI